MSAGVSVYRRLRRRFVRAAGLTAARGFALAANVVAPALVARWTGPDVFAPLALSQSVLLTVSGIMALGLPLFVLRAASLRHLAAVGFGLAVNLVTTLAVVGVGVVLAAAGAWLDGALLVALAAAIALEKNQEVRIGLGLEFGRAGVVNTTIAARGAILLAGVALTGMTHADAVAGYVVSRLLASVLAAGLLTVVTRGWRLRWRPPRDGTLASLGGFAVGDLVGALKSLDVWVVGTVGSASAAGFYGAVNRLGTPLTLLATSLRTVFLGAAVRGARSQARAAVRALAWATLALSAVAAGLATCSGDIVVLVLGEGFADASGALLWTLLAAPALATGPLVAALLQAKGLTSMIAWNTGVWNVVFLAGAAVTVAPWGATGAAAMLAVSTWGKYLTLTLRARRAFPDE